MTDKGITLEDLTQRFKISSGILENEVSDDDIREISTFLESWKLAAPHLGLSNGEIEAIENDGKSEEEKRVLMLQRWKQALAFKATYKELINSLLSVRPRRADLAVKVCQTVVSTSSKSQLTVGTHLEALNELKVCLSHIKRWKEAPRKIAAQEGAVADFISRSVESGCSLETIKEQFQALYSKELQISKEMFLKAQQLASEEYAKANLTARTTPANVPTSAKSTEVVEPLFCKDTIYHASICSQVVNTCTAGDYQRFFKNKELVPGHAFKAVSFSRSKNESFLIAQKGESVFYFAFKGRLSLSDWAKDYKSFNEGIMAQCEVFPIRYIIELLNKQSRIVLTGFSFGGLLASTVLARVWDTPYISSELLKENLTCITFGQPHVRVEVIQRVARRRPEMVSTIHAILTEGDQLPSLMGFLDECWSDRVQLAQSRDALGIHLSAVANHSQKAPFEDQLTSCLLQKFAKLQKEHHLSESAKMIEDLKAKLQEMLHDCGEYSNQYTPSFLQYKICHAESATATVMIPVKPDSCIIAAHHIHEFNTTTHKEHIMLEYSKSIFESYLDKPPKYAFPDLDVKQHALGDVDDSKPSIYEVQIHHHGNESAVVMEGNNLWFCYQLSFRGLKLSVPASDISGSSIQFNGIKVPTELMAVLSSGKEIVNLFSHFKSKAIRQEVEVHERRYSTTTRQEQLAKLVPSQVIELAYLSALLEQQCGTSLLSNKLEIVRRFLEDVVQVVPFESIAYAIANGNSHTAVQCLKALKMPKVTIPKTTVMYSGLKEAMYQLEYGIPSEILHSMEFKAAETLGYFRNMSERVYYGDSGKLVYEVNSYIPGIALPLHEPVRIQTEFKPQVPSSTQIVEDIKQLQWTLFPKFMKASTEFIDNDIELVSKANIEDLYPISSEESFGLKSPLDILISGRKQLTELSDSTKLSESYSKLNQEMLKTVNTIRHNELDTCTSLLGGFMHQGVVYISLSSHKHPLSDFGVHAAASVGVWALFSLNYEHVKPILLKCQGEQLLIKLFDHVKGISGINHESDDRKFNPYAAKLQFVAQGMAKTVTMSCNAQNVSYSLERQLVELCNERGINTAIPLSYITGKWSVLFKENILSLVDQKCRLLIARWLKWALMIHNLREELAKYTAVGVVGLVNSGKSKLVNTLFNIKIPTGTTESKRTTVPFLYNLDESVEGLNVVDFPGVDDEDDSIGDLADLLLTIAQIVVFVVDYRKVHTQSAKKWLERLSKEKVPILVCLTFGDKLYAEHMSESGDHPRASDMAKVIKSQVTIIREKLRSSGCHQIQFFSFCQDKDSVLNSDLGRQKLREVGIGTPLQVGEWLVKVFKEDFQQNDLASQLEVFIGENVTNTSVKGP